MLVGAAEKTERLTVLRYEDDMGLEKPEAQFLRRLYKLTREDRSVQVSMYEIGADLGMDRGVSSRTAESLIGAGLLEIRTLSGGISITDAGVSELERRRGAASDITVRLGEGLIVSDGALKALNPLLVEIKSFAGQSGLDFDLLAELVADLHTADAQLASPKPKTAVLREVLLSLHQVLKRAGRGDLERKIRQLTQP